MFSELYPLLFSFQSILLLVVVSLTFYVSSFFLFRDVDVSDLEKKAVLITGCDSGFGYELAKKLDARGLQVFAACLTAEGQAKLKSECSRTLITLKLDVADQIDVQKALEFVKSRLPSQGEQCKHLAIGISPLNFHKRNCSVYRSKLTYYYCNISCTNLGAIAEYPAHFEGHKSLASSVLQSMNKLV